MLFGATRTLVLVGGVHVFYVVVGNESRQKTDNPVTRKSTATPDNVYLGPVQDKDLQQSHMGLANSGHPPIKEFFRHLRRHDIEHRDGCQR
jgi:hypothetical protein